MGKKILGIVLLLPSIAAIGTSIYLLLKDSLFKKVVIIEFYCFLSIIILIGLISVFVMIWSCTKSGISFLTKSEEKKN